MGGALDALEHQPRRAPRNGQPGTHAEKRPAVPPATTMCRRSGSLNFGARAPSTEIRHSSQTKRRTSAFDQPSAAIVAACSGAITSSVSPSGATSGLAMTAPARATVVRISRAVRPAALTTTCGGSAAITATVLSAAAKPCSTDSGSQGLASSCSPMQYE